ncbi:hypothetical protein HPB50_009032 [Hyalomma asiaticum]|uniref:Uncharacterized protein n=1 Tax=Hyalomma asiaticum TaxID=266040 RepID=A0ACB7SUV3_HYAAI|nr:hypothetical protein HPB50_009032 [Hyalomma asiaticum]
MDALVFYCGDAGFLRQLTHGWLRDSGRLPRLRCSRAALLLAPPFLPAGIDAPIGAAEGSGSLRSRKTDMGEPLDDLPVLSLCPVLSES